MERENLGIVLRDFGSSSAPAIGFSDDSRLLRQVAQVMAIEYRERIAKMSAGAHRAIEEARLRVLERIALVAEAEGASSARPWWEAMTDEAAQFAKEEEHQRQ